MLLPPLLPGPVLLPLFTPAMPLELELLLLPLPSLDLLNFLSLPALLLPLPGLDLLNFLPVPVLLPLLLAGLGLALLCTVALKANGPCLCPPADAAAPVFRAKPEEPPLAFGGP